MKKVSETMAKVIDFKENGHFSEEMLNIKGSGRWRFNNELTKLGYVFYIYNGITMPYDTAIIPNQIIMKLTSDTLVLSFETYDGKAKTYGYEDWFYARIR
jgi:hypothetical protein